MKNLTTRYLPEIGYTEQGREVYSFRGIACYKEAFRDEYNVPEDVFIPILKKELLSEAEQKELSDCLVNIGHYGEEVQGLFTEESINNYDLLLENYKDKMHTNKSIQAHFFKIDDTLSALLNKVKLIATTEDPYFKNNKLEFKSIKLELKNLEKFHFCLREELNKLGGKNGSREASLLNYVNKIAKEKFRVWIREGTYQLNYRNNSDGVYIFGEELDTLDGIRIHGKTVNKERV